MSILAVLAAAAQARTYAVWNSADKGSGITLSGGDLVASISSGSAGVRANMGKSTGKWYWEVTLGGSGPYWFAGLANASQAVNGAYPSDPNASGIQTNGYYWNAGGIYYSGLSAASGDVLRFAADLDAHTLEVYRGATQIAVISSIQTGTVYPIVGDTSSSATFTANFGATAFAHSPLSGYNPGWYV